MLDPFLEEIAAGAPEHYAPLDIYRDFLRIFMETDEGRRVLHQIFTWAGLYRSSAKRAAFDPNETMFHEGARDLGLTIMRAMATEPKPQPGTTHG